MNDATEKAWAELERLLTEDSGATAYLSTVYLDLPTTARFSQDNGIDPFDVVRMECEGVAADLYYRISEDLKKAMNA